MRRLACFAAFAVAAALLVVVTASSDAARAGGVVRPAAIASDFPDPAITRDGATYYLYATNIRSGSKTLNVPVARSADLDSWAVVGDALPTVGSWARTGATWAPGVAKVGTQWLLYYTASDVASGRQCVGRATSTTPTGPFRDDAAAPLVCQVDGGGSIDPSPFVDTDGTAWLLWKSDGNAIGADTVIWVQRLSTDGRSLTGSATEVLRADRDWESTVIEGPAMVRSGSTLLLFYSGGLWDTAGYAVGYARCSSPAGACTKVTTSSPWLSSATGGIPGPGGESFTTAPSGRLVMAFHGWVGAVGYGQGGNRDAFIEPVTVTNGVPDWRPELSRTGELHTPIGNVDALAAVPGGGTIAGWTIDPDTAASIAVHVYVDGHFATAASAAASRPDVASAFPGYGGAHGFAVTVGLAAGPHTLCAFAINVGAGSFNPLLACGVVTVAGGLPFGNLDAVTPRPSGAIVSGWAIDPDIGGAVEIDVYADGRFAGWGYAATDRADVGAAFPRYGARHGFAIPVALAPGLHDVCAYAIDVPAGAANPWLGCRRVAVTTGVPFGNLDAATAVPGGVRVAGWAIDPDTVASLDVHVYVDGAFAGWGTAAENRPDVGAAFPPYGSAHGFTVTVGAPAGPHRVCAYAIDVGGPGINAAVGCATVTV